MNSSEDQELHIGIESELPRDIAVGRGNLLMLHGWCFHARRPIRRLDAQIDGETQPLIADGAPRPDVAQRLAGSADEQARAYSSGFWGLLTLGEVSEPRQVEIGLTAKLDGGAVVSKRIGQTLLLPGKRPSWQSENGGLPKVVVCMATFNPPPELFRRQIDSIRAQTYPDWLCLISDDDSRPEAFALIEEVVGDDPRFRIERNPRRLGVYRNFERALASVPTDAGLVALADQDDRWEPDKLASLQQRIAGGATLAYSDMRITDPAGQTIAPTFWTERANNPDDLGALLIVNSITGGASMFRSDLLDYILPFPDQAKGSLHDHWIGMVAMSLGEVGFVDRPLYDYVQHAGAALGHERTIKPPRPQPRRTRLRTLRDRSALRAAIVERVTRMRANYTQVLRVRAAAELLLVRGGKRVSRRKRRVLRRCIRLERSPAGWAWLLWLRGRSLLGISKTLNDERMLISGSLWRAMLGAIMRLRLPPVDPRRQTLTTMLKLPLASEPAGAAHLQRLIEPLRLDVSADAPQRVNIVIPTIDLGHFFGGYIAKFNLARKLAEAGLRVRIVVVDEPFYLPASWRQDIERFEGLEGVMDLIEVELAHDRSKELQVSPGDRFVATTWWTAHVAHRASDDLGGRRFLYLIQECEPLTMPMGSEAALARQTYDFPHYALFSTDLLREYFRRDNLGVFAGKGNGDEDSVAFENAITPVRPATAEEMRESERKLLFYARPELHAERNMFDLGMLALSQASSEGTLEGWELHGIGAQQAGELRHGDLRIEILERQDQSDYASLLRGHAVGLSLMLTPHPSLVPLEMAASGMPVVTNTFENKTPEALAAISENLIAAEPTIEGVKAGIREAVAASADHERRLRGAEVRWSRSWEESFSPPLVERLKVFIEKA